MLTDCDKGYIDIRCDVVGESFTEMCISLQSLDRGVRSVVIEVKGHILYPILSEYQNNEFNGQTSTGQRAISMFFNRIGYKLCSNHRGKLAENTELYR